CFFRNNPFSLLIGKCLDRPPSLTVLYRYRKVRCHTFSPVNERTDCRCHLNRRYLERLAKSHGGKFHLPDIFQPVHDCSCLSREIHPGFFHQAELLEIIAEPLRSQSEPDLHKNRITGILHSFHECLRPVSSYFVAPDSPILYNLIRSEEHTSELQSRFDLVCRLLL